MSGVVIVAWLGVGDGLCRVAYQTCIATARHGEAGKPLCDAIPKPTASPLMKGGPGQEPGLQDAASVNGKGPERRGTSCSVDSLLLGCLLAR